MVLLPLRVQCPGRVCAAIAAGLGGRGRCRFRSLPSRPSRSVLRVVLPVCPFPSPAGTPFHSVCAFRRLGPLALRVRAACSSGGGALMLPRGSPRPPFRVGVARALSAVPVQGAGRAVPGGSCPSAFPAAVPCSAYLARGRVARSLSPLASLRVARPPVGRPPFVCWLCALWGRHEGARGGRPLPGCGASGVGLSPTPNRPSFGACGPGPLPTGCGCGERGRGDPSPTPQHALLRAGFARFGGGTRAPGGRASCLCVGRPGSSALPPPTVRPLGRAAGARYPLAVGAGSSGVGTRHQPHNPRSCELALRAVGAA